jgi:hypothetical protein
VLKIVEVVRLGTGTVEIGEDVCETKELDEDACGTEELGEDA